MAKFKIMISIKFPLKCVDSKVVKLILKAFHVNNILESRNKFTIIKQQH